MMALYGFSLITLLQVSVPLRFEWVEVEALGPQVAGGAVQTARGCDEGGGGGVGGPLAAWPCV
jgi:hypothetical protein